MTTATKIESAPANEGTGPVPAPVAPATKGKGKGNVPNAPTPAEQLGSHVRNWGRVQGKGGRSFQTDALMAARGVIALIGNSAAQLDLSEFGDSLKGQTGDALACIGYMLGVGPAATVGAFRTGVRKAVRPSK